MTLRILLRSVIASLALSVMVSPLAAQPPPQQSRRTVCYTLLLIPGPDGDPTRWGAAHIPPDTVALDSMVAMGAPRIAGYRLRPAIGGRAAGTGSAPVWRATGDSLEMIWHNGLTGVHLRGRAVQDAYLGTATVITDVRTRRPPARAIVEGQMVPCPAHLRTAAGR